MNRHRKELVLEWLNKAEGDYTAAISLSKNRKKKNLLFIIAFHCQQAAEKHLKALLICHSIDFPKTHDLLELLDLAITKDSFLLAIKKELQILNPFAVAFRYPGEDIDLEDLKEILAAVKIVISILVKRIKEFI
ncbi:hypothetical protein A2291_07465 [candidate division WOR-1 bacterium RIFOXYB2_FULL_42_35]|uniref:HEPN domain-containing protein n=1 Tax=candidate division WOR-1 bacterium RIFOXYC2_FULL_41_25 TaxID=1802586 RepID=A0A1F4TKA9_UNCSA|nr:MAG: hypothetical protein A2247_04325 [candidate division WOR-1 bacterium RIFOXYA2_FULL_41_14]OGC22744.1 MAG: hypothetical protein A2291_07465 [candidate division WOR-1 bacterium RIFOXYB2_FULL_42_35]OGC33165.1 MAG: hypothetical protein A2462_06360 [candidate division WOR-1 bacterium RIFOXYC2_FULL_41_25]